MLDRYLEKFERAIENDHYAKVKEALAQLPQVNR